MNALVTGAGGFLGLAIVRQLVARGDRVRALCRGSSAELHALGVETVPADLRDREAVITACDGAEAVFHVGAVVGTSGPWDRYGATNYWGTRYIVDGCLKHRVGRLVFASCSSVMFDGEACITPDCGAGDSPAPFRAGQTSASQETDEPASYPRKWLGHYPQTKAMAERQVLAASGLEELAACVLRLPLSWGPGNKQFLPWLLAQSRSGRLRRIGDRDHPIDTIHVENAAEAHLLAADAMASNRDSPPAGHAYFIAQVEPVNCWQWIDHLLALANLPPVVESIPYEQAWRRAARYDLMWRLLRRRGDPPLSRLRVVELGRCQRFDTTAAARDFGFIPRVSTEEGLRQMRTKW